jgi:hypothetical protein
VFVCHSAFAQELPPLTADGLLAQHLGDTLMEAPAVEQASLDVAEPAAVPAVTGEGSGGDPVKRAGSRWRFAPHLDFRFTYDDNIFIRPTNQVSDFIFTAAPGLSVGYWEFEEEWDRFIDREGSASVIEKGRGNFLLLDYTAILLGFAKTTSQNAFDQDARIEARWEAAKLTLGGGVHFESKSEANSEVGGRVRRTSVATAVTGQYQFTERTALEVQLHNEVTEHEGFIRSVEWRNEDYLDYQATPLLHLGLGAAFGLVQVESSPDQVFERILGRAIYSLTEKVSVAARGGVEFRQVDGDVGDRVNPVFDLTAEYSPVAGTRVVAEAFRRVETSVLQPDQDLSVSGFGLKIRRTLIARLALQIGGGWQIAEYTDTPDDPGRTDEEWFARAGFLYNFNRWANAELTYEHRQNDSSRPSSSFEDNQVTLTIGLTY